VIDVHAFGAAAQKRKRHKVVDVTGFGFSVF
jgi:hypothetical protein